MPVLVNEAVACPWGLCASGVSEQGQISLLRVVLLANVLAAHCFSQLHHLTTLFSIQIEIFLLAFISWVSYGNEF